MTTILVILGIGAALGGIWAVSNKENPFSGMFAGAFMAGSCMLQLLIPVVVLLAGFVLLRMIVG